MTEPFARARRSDNRSAGERFAEGMVRFRQAMGAEATAENPFDAAYREAERFNRDRDFHIAQYRAAGIAPRFTDPAKVYVETLALLLQMGWTIVEGVGGNRLHKPDSTAA